jgi:DNA-directed RNA polymerase specialized sigma24 family protein
MENLINNFQVIRNTVMRFLQIKFRTSNLLFTDIEDAFSVAFEKLIKDQGKTNPKLVPTEQTLRYLALNAIIDAYRQKRRETLLDNFSNLPPLSTITIETDVELEKKERLEFAITQVKCLPTDRMQALIASECHAYEWQSTTTHEEIIKAKSSPRKTFKELGYSSNGAMRLEKHRAIALLRSWCS